MNPVGVFVFAGEYSRNAYPPITSPEVQASATAFGHTSVYFFSLPLVIRIFSLDSGITSTNHSHQTREQPLYCNLHIRLEIPPLAS